MHQLKTLTLKKKTLKRENKLRGKISIQDRKQIILQDKDLKLVLW